MFKAADICNGLPTEIQISQWSGSNDICHFEIYRDDDIILYSLAIKNVQYVPHWNWEIRINKYQIYQQ